MAASQPASNLPSLAKVAKDKGNASFKAGNFAEAVGQYSAGILADQQDHTLPLNRAAAFLKLAKYRDAERDCTTVLGLDEKNIKALFRRAQARAALGILTEAEKDLKSALEKDPTNDSVRRELAAVQKRALETIKPPTLGETAIPAAPPLTSSSSPKEDYTPRKRAWRKVPIEIVESDDTPTPEAHNSHDNFLRPVRSRTLATSSTSQSIPLPSPQPTAAPQTKPRVGAAIFRADGKYTILRDPSSSSSSNSSSTSTIPSQKATPDRSSPFNSSTLTHFAFSRAWYAMAAIQERYSFLLSIPPGSLPALFQTSLEPTLLASILETLSGMMSSTTSAAIAEYMDAFPTIPRFATVLLFLDSKEKAVLRHLLDALGYGQDARRKAWGF